MKGSAALIEPSEFDWSEAKDFAARRHHASTCCEAIYDCYACVAGFALKMPLKLSRY